MKITGILVALCAAIFSFGQSGTWKEMNDFHEVVGKVLHPVESGNLQPLKSNSSDLMNKAIKWKNASSPAAYSYPQLAADLDKLVADCTSLNDAVKAKKNDKELKRLAMQTHNQYHHIASATESKKN